MQACRTGDSGLPESRLLLPGSAIVACNEQDITRKGSKKGRHQLLMILPHQLAFRKGYETELGELQHANTNTPSFVVKTAKGVLTYPGRFVSTATSFFTIDLVPKAQQSVMSEMYQQLLVFDEPVLTKTKERAQDAQEDDGGDAAGVAWTQLCGISSAADPPVAEASKRSRKEQAPSPTLSATTSDNAEEGSQQSDARPTRKAAQSSGRYVERGDEFDSDEQSNASSDVLSFKDAAPKRQEVNRTRAKNAKTYEESEEEDDQDEEESSISSEESEEYVESSKRKRR